MRLALYLVRALIVLLLLVDIRIIATFVIHGLPVNAVPVESAEGPAVKFEPLPWTGQDTLYLAGLLAIHVLLFGGELLLRRRRRAAYAPPIESS